jgi:hypothetical protein
MASPTSPKTLSQTQSSETSIFAVCPHCHGDLAELSAWGRLNHVDWCRIVVGVPDVKPRSTEIPTKHHGGPGSETVQARNYAPEAL